MIRIRMQTNASGLKDILEKNIRNDKNNEKITLRKTSFIFSLIDLCRQFVRLRLRLDQCLKA